jgi:uncharacterized membrane protein
MSFFAAVRVPEVVLRARRPPIIALAACMALYVVVFGILTWKQQARYATFGFDMGIFDQGIWLLSRFRDAFVTVRGLHYFGNHVNILSVLLVPFYWLGAGPHFLYLAQTVAVALAAIPLFLLARHRLANEWHAVAIAAAYLLYPALQWITWWHFHPDAFSIGLLILAYLCMVHERWRWYAVVVVALLLNKEDTVFAVFVLGLLVARRGNRRVGFITAGGALAWFVVATQILIPWLNHGGEPFYATLYPTLGDSIGEIVFNAVRHPSRILDVLFEDHRITYYGKLLWPVALLPVAGVPAALIAVPQLVINASSVQATTYDIRFQYTAIIVAVTFISTIEAIARLSDRKPARQGFLVGVVLAASVAANLAWSPSPLSREYRSGVWAATAPHSTRVEAMDAAVALVPADAGVSATYNLVPHLTHRSIIYEYPTPLKRSYYGLDSQPPRYRGRVTWYVLDTAVIDETNKALYDALLDHGFQQIFNREGIVVARRRGG